MCVIETPEGENGGEAVCEEIMAKNFPERRRHIHRFFFFKKQGKRKKIHSDTS